MRDGAAVRLAVATAAAVLVALIAFVGVAAVTSRAWAFTAAGMATFVITLTGVGVLATRSLPGGARRRARSCGLPAVIAIGIAVFVLSALLPTSDPRRPAAPVAGQRTWMLDGSRIAYVKIAARGRSTRPPVVFLHGGPGVPDLRGDAAYFGQLAHDGHDVYVYDQVGTGRSSRLPDPAGYSVGRDAADLEAIRQQIGARRMILIGHSYGAQLAAAYLADHPDRVSRAVFSSPGSIDPARSGGDLTARLDTAQKLATYALTLRPRVLLAYGLVQVAPESAHRFVGDAEMDARFDRLYHATKSALHCHDHPPGPDLFGLGAYANAYPQSASAPQTPDPRPALRSVDTPALVIKAACDYEPWSAGQDLLGAMRNARLVYLDHAGHNSYQERPRFYLNLVRAFLAGQALPAPIRPGGGAPFSFEGPS